ncbi:conjugal transfer protein, partial [Bacillus cereus]|nr:conjugal transfer protein [Bacillus cereus]
IDPEHEYIPLAEAFHGEIIRVSAGTGTRINPLDIVLDDQDADPVKEKTNNVVAMIGSLIGGNSGLTAIEKSLVDRATMQLYAQYR